LAPGDPGGIAKVGQVSTSRRLELPSPLADIADSSRCRIGAGGTRRALTLDAVAP